MSEIRFLNPEVSPYRTSEIRRIQDFYGVKYEDLANVEKLKQLWLKQEEITYCLENKDKEFALKSTEWFELREWVTNTVKYKKLQEHYWFSLKDTQNVEILKSLWLSIEDIEFITNKKIEVEVEEVEETKNITKKRNRWQKK